MTGSHEQAATDALGASVEANYAAVSAAVREFGQAIILVRENAALEERMRRVGRFAQAAKALHESAKRTWEDAKTALADAFSETGIPRVRTANHTIAPSEGVREVHIVRPESIPDRFWVTNRYISIPLLREALEAGEDLSGAAMLGNSGAMHVRFTPHNREKVA